ncbi:uncharacterized protein LOC135928508 [Gordionus sp. m RMFG-2023]|uniref:uncharacterized protein LOC135928508 n=1 Tax=Gordionus sp. m RMFG-2023 TaxID=3053472 RepID=UPI0031FCF3FA
MCCHTMTCSVSIFENPVDKKDNSSPNCYLFSCGLNAELCTFARHNHYSLSFHRPKSPENINSDPNIYPPSYYFNPNVEHNIHREEFTYDSIAKNEVGDHDGKIKNESFRPTERGNVSLNSDGVMKLKNRKFDPSSNAKNLSFQYDIIMERHDANEGVRTKYYILKPIADIPKEVKFIVNNRNMPNEMNASKLSLIAMSNNVTKDIITHYPKHQIESEIAHKNDGNTSKFTPKYDPNDWFRKHYEDNDDNIKRYPGNFNYFYLPFSYSKVEHNKNDFRSLANIFVNDDGRKSYLNSEELVQNVKSQQPKRRARQDSTRHLDHAHNNRKGKQNNFSPRWLKLTQFSDVKSKNFAPYPTPYPFKRQASFDSGLEPLPYLESARPRNYPKIKATQLFLMKEPNDALMPPPRSPFNAAQIQILTSRERNNAARYSPSNNKRLYQPSIQNFNEADDRSNYYIYDQNEKADTTSLYDYKYPITRTNSQLRIIDIECNSEYEFKCLSGSPSCIAIYDVCDKIPHCQDGSDEIDCPRFKSKTKTKESVAMNATNNIFTKNLSRLLKTGNADSRDSSFIYGKISLFRSKFKLKKRKLLIGILSTLSASLFLFLLCLYCYSSHRLNKSPKKYLGNNKSWRASKIFKIFPLAYLFDFEFNHKWFNKYNGLKKPDKKYYVNGLTLFDDYQYDEDEEDNDEYQDTERKNVKKETNKEKEGGILEDELFRRQDYEIGAGKDTHDVVHNGHNIKGTNRKGLLEPLLFAENQDFYKNEYFDNHYQGSARNNIIKVAFKDNKMLDGSVSMGSQHFLDSFAAKKLWNKKSNQNNNGHKITRGLNKPKGKIGRHCTPITSNNIESEDI